MQRPLEILGQKNKTPNKKSQNQLNEPKLTKPNQPNKTNKSQSNKQNAKQNLKDFLPDISSDCEQAARCVFRNTALWAALHYSERFFQDTSLSQADKWLSNGWVIYCKTKTFQK